MYFVVVELNWKTKIKNLTGLLQKLNCKIITITGFDIKKNTNSVFTNFYKY